MNTPTGSPTVIGVIADTHVPDRNSTLMPGILEALRQAQVSLILHAGDIAGPSVLRSLEAVAPVKAVRGNRDFLFRPPLPVAIEFSIEGVRIAMAHGHGTLASYLLDKLHYLRNGYAFARYHRLLARQFPHADVIVFGHTHRSESRREDGRLYFNPGAAYACQENAFKVQYGLMRVYANGAVETEVQSL